MFRFGVVGATGFVLDLGTFHLLLGAGAGLGAAHISGFLLASISNYSLNRRWVFPHAEPGRYARFLLIGLLALILRGAVIAAGVELLALPATVALIGGVGVAAALNYLGAVFFVFSTTHANSPEARWRAWAAGILAFSFVLRFLYLGIVELMPQEAYYWNYAQHPALSYLDHPPLTAWGIMLGTFLFGDGQFGVRFATFVVSMLSAGFVVAFARNLQGRHAAIGAALLYGAFPAYLATGYFATPDAMLVCGWAATLYFLERAIVARRERAWIGVGVAFGFGLLAKYTIVLLAPATLALLLFDRRFRPVLRRPGPYLACAIALLIFSPVIWWNAQNDWISFAFQTTERAASGDGFSLHLLAAAGMIVLTPPGFILALRASVRDLDPSDESGARRRNFTMALTLLPFSVFVIYSLTHRVMKLDWTIPIWLAVLPAMGRILWRSWRAPRGPWRIGIWKLNVVVAPLLIGFMLHWFVLGIPGVPPRHSRAFPIAWKEMSNEVDRLAAELERADGATPIVIDATSYYIASEMAYYGRDTRDGVRTTSAAHLIGARGLMYEFWVSPDDWRGAPALFVSFRPGDLGDRRFAGQAKDLSALKERDVLWNGQKAAAFWYRTGRLRAKGPGSPNEARSD